MINNISINSVVKQWEGTGEAIKCYKEHFSTFLGRVVNLYPSISALSHETGISAVRISRYLRRLIDTPPTKEEMEILNSIYNSKIAKGGK
jgi:hypothetical protein